MKGKMKRFLTIFLVVVLVCFILISSAMAVTPIRKYIGSRLGFYSMNDNDATRVVTWSSPVSVYLADWWSIAAGTMEIQWSDARIALASYSGMLVSTQAGLQISSGTYIDVESAVNYSDDVVDSLLLNGGGKISFSSYIKAISGSSEVSSGNVYPDTVQILIDGNPVGDPLAVSAVDGTFTFNDLSFPLTSAVASIGYRFGFNEEKTNLGSDLITGSVAYFAMQLDDDGVFTSVNADDTAIGWLQNIWMSSETGNSILIQILNSNNAILKFLETMDQISMITTPSEEDQTKVDEFEQQLQDQITEADKIQETIDSLDTPPPAEIVPDVSTIVTSEDAAVYSDAIGGLFQNSIITNMLLIALSICLVSYVLFGKK